MTMPPLVTSPVQYTKSTVKTQICVKRDITSYQKRKAQLESVPDLRTAVTRTRPRYLATNQKSTMFSGWLYPRKGTQPP